ncbi:MAG TPA: 3-oxoacyl-ACP reductase family protein [Symbiobacteriaceae bacterium]|nr:3-oxoacyl-ACP reductase family protein [Symbiobacteriaceae bacterium]
MLQGKVALVTGAARGIGKAIAVRLQEAGATVVINDVLAEELQQALADGAGSSAVVADVSARHEVQAMVDQVVERFGKLDILVNNAGVEPKAPMLEMTDEQWNRAIAVNLNGVFLGTQIAARHMVSRGQGGRIIQISSIAAKNYLPNCANYCASKAGVNGFTREAARELAPHGITVNAVCPGVIETEMTAAARTNPAMMEKWMREIPARRLGHVEEVAAFVAFLASPEAAYITGQSLNIDGGKVPW